mmetsp:Transcript_32415/g.62289  ORF Transcript_32415/g.62289 Transcript_32415/m.62289 type:complete len:151 (+) Transcript_32415:1785-2237(+)
MSANEYLKNLPTSVIRNGKVINVRSELESMLKAASQAAPEQALIDTTATSALFGRRSSGSAPHDPAGDGTSGSSTTLRIKAEDGSSTYILKLSANNTIGDVRNYVDKHRGSTGSYEIRSSFPAKAYENNSQTLGDADLVPNAALFLKSLG